jgi:uncharacterized membrane protein YuzA (DUF378 family)
MEMKETFDLIAKLLANIGAANWLLWKVFNFDLVATLFSGFTPLDTIIYALVGLSGLYLIVLMIMKMSQK